MSGCSFDYYSVRCLCVTSNHAFRMMSVQFSVNIGDTAEALDWYSKGVTELEKGVAVEVRAEGAPHTNVVNLVQSLGIVG